MWILPPGSRYANDSKYNLATNGHFKLGQYYRLVQLASRGFAMLGMLGEIRHCPQKWAVDEANAARIGGLTVADELGVDSCPEVEAWSEEVEEMIAEVEDDWCPLVEAYEPEEPVEQQRNL